MNLYYKGIRLNYDVIGKGEYVLFLHGWGGSYQSFKPQYEHLSQNYTCILVDFIGFGLSGLPNVPYTLDDYAQSVLLLLDHLKVEKTHIICHSFGGRVAFKLMASNSERFISAIMCCPAGVKPRRNLKYFASVFTYKIKKRLRKLGAISGDFELASGSSDYRELIGTMRPTFVNVVKEDLTRLFKKIKTPILLVYGLNDTAVPLYMIKKIKRKIPSSDYITLQGGHFCYLVDLYRFLRVCDSFLKDMSK